VDKKNIQEILALTPLQEGLLYHYRQQPESEAYREQLCLEITGEIDRLLFDKTWQEIVHTNEMMRTRYRWERMEKPVQIVMKNHRLEPVYEDLSLENARQKELRREEIREKERKKKFDLRDVPVRITLVKIEKNEYEIIIGNHHIQFDGWSTGIILKEFFETYERLSKGRKSLRVEKPKFKEILKWHRAQDTETQKKFWKDYLDGYEPVLHQLKNIETATANLRQRKIELQVEKRNENRLDEFARKYRITPATILDGVWGMVLLRCANRDDVAFGTPVSGRNIPVKGIGDIVGLLINTVPQRIRCRHGETVLQWLERIHAEKKNREPYELTPLSQIKEWGRNDEKNELFDTIHVLENYPLDSRLRKKYGPLTLKSYRMEEQTHYPLTATVTLFDGIRLTLQYDEENFNEETIRRLAGHYYRIWNEIVQNPNREVGRLELLTEKEKHQLQVEFNRTAEDYPDKKTLHELFEEQAQKTPERSALIGNTTVTYHQLKLQTDSVAAHLTGKGIEPGNIVAIKVRPSVEMVAGILGILKSGAAYLPVEPDAPDKRIEYIINDSMAPLMVTENEIRDMGNHRSVNHGQIPEKFLSTNLAYVIYTSGTTGKPKGVMVEHKSVVNCLWALNRMYPLNQGDTYLLKTSYTFDVSATELFGWFIGGGRQVILEKGGEKDPAVIRDTVERETVTHINFVPTMFNEFAGQITKQNIRQLKSLKYLFLLGEEVTPGPVKMFTQMAPNVKIENLYGPTEATIYATGFSMALYDWQGPVPIGKPFPNYRINILDRYGRYQPVRALGELCIAGDGLARGYLNNPQLTAEKFYYDKNLEQKYYKTGDQASWRQDGNIFYRGRQDQQVKIRGYRIELREIEALLLRHEAVQEAAVIVRTDKTGDKQICAYVVRQQDETKVREELRDYLDRQLPEYMVPAAIVDIERMPVKSGGKLDRAALPEPWIGRKGEYQPPRNEREEQLVRIWADILGREPSAIGIHDNFLSLGGHSIRAAALVSRIERDIYAKISISDVFKYATVAKLSNRLQAVRAKSQWHDEIKPAEEKDFYEVTPAQKRMYLQHQQNPESTIYNITGLMEIRGRMDAGKIREHFKRAIEQHEILRTSYRQYRGRPVQRVHQKATLEYRHYEVNTGNEKQPEQARERIIRDFIQSFELERPPHLRVGVIAQGLERNLLIIDQHHIASDGATIDILLKEFLRYLEGQELPRRNLQYKDYVQWLLQNGHRNRLKKQEEYWKKQYEEQFPQLELPYDKPRTTKLGIEGRQVSVEIPAEDVKAIKTLAAGEGITLFMVYQAAAAIFLSKLCGQQHVIMGTPVSGRSSSHRQDIVGLLVNTVVLRSKPTGRKTVTEFLAEVKENTLKAMDNQDYPFEALVQSAAPGKKWEQGRNPLFDVMFQYQETESQLKVPGLTIEIMPTGITTAKFDQTIRVEQINHRVQLSIEYKTDLYEEETIKRYLKYIKKLIADIGTQQQTPIEELELIGPREKKEIVEKINATTIDYPSKKTTHRLYMEQAARTPDRIALKGTMGSIEKNRGPVPTDHAVSYKELNERSGNVAARLNAMGIKPGHIVGIEAERTQNMVIGLLGILMAGAAYMPIDPAYPAERKKYMQADSNASVILTEKQIEQYALGGELKNRNLKYGETLETKHHASSQLAYVMYTSGTTGKSKGVMVEHRNVIRLISSPNYVRLTEETRILQTGAVVFDAATFEIWGSLLNGGRLVQVTNDVLLDPKRLKKELKRCKINTLWLSAALFNQHVRRDLDIFSGLSNLLIGGEELTPETVNRVRSKYRELKIINGYGPTENTTFSVCYNIPYEYEYKIPIGTPICNSTAYVLTRDLRHQPVGVPGELYVGGDGVARGYMNNPELTAQRFVQDHFAPTSTMGNRLPLHHSSSGGRLYKTGDRGMWRPGGIIEYRGRLDQQVKIRGFRVEPAEIETLLLKHEAVAETVVRARTRQNGDKELIAYIEPKTAKKVERIRIREYLAARLPGYMIPTGYVILEQMPLNRSGKLDRNALPEPGTADLINSDQIIYPRNESEKTLVKIWAAILGEGVRTVSVTDDFFQRGGHSLKAMELASRLHEELDIEFPLEEIFKNPTLEAQARILERRESGSTPRLEAVEQKEYYEQTSAQKRMYAMHRRDPESTAYNISGKMELIGDVDIQRFRNTLAGLVARHEALRTSYEEVNGIPVQRIHEQAELKIQIHDIASLPGEQRDKKTLENAFRKPFDITSPPLMRVGLIKEEEKKYTLILSMHHIVADGTTVEIILKEFVALYAGEELPKPRFQYKDYGISQQRRIKERQKLWKYWRQQYRDEIPEQALPADNPRPLQHRYEGAQITIEIDEQYRRALKKITLEKGYTLFQVHSAVAAIYIAKQTGSEDVVLGTPVAGRTAPGTENIVGLFVNTLALRTRPEGQKNFCQFLEEVKHNTQRALENQDYPFEELVENISPDHEPGRNPIFDVLVQHENRESMEIEIPRLKFIPLPEETTTSKFDQTLKLVESGRKLFLTIEYSTNLFKTETIERCIGYYKKILAALIDKPERRIAQQEIIEPREKREILYDINATAAVYPDHKTLDRLEEEQARKNPDGISVTGCRAGNSVHETVTHRQLNRQITRMAIRLREIGVTVGDIVAVKVERSIQMVIGIQGILKAGAAYLPIDPKTPAERIEFIMKDSRAVLMLTENEIWEMANGSETASTPQTTNHTPSNPAYVIYTSGTTGKPKGVILEHRPVVNLLWALQPEQTHPRGDVYLLKTPYVFDVSVTELFGRYVGGGRLAILEPRAEKEPAKILEKIAQQQVTRINFVPTMFNEFVVQLTAENAPQLSSLKSVHLAGETAAPGTINRFMEMLPAIPVENLYGPTEATVYATRFKLSRKPNERTVPIGQPFPNTKIYILDKYGNHQPLGVPGELCIAGIGLARGYLNRPEPTASQFVKAFGGRDDLLLYRTGDKARWRTDGNIEFLGRQDRQVKIRGNRVELGEIEAALKCNSTVSEAAVMVRTDKTGDRYLIAHVVPKEQVEELEKQLRNHLISLLPGYMIPAVIVVLEQMPRTPSGKLDRRALPEPGEVESESFIPPGNYTEQRLQAMWADILGKNKTGIGIRDNFYRLGGHSIKAVRLAAQIHKEMQVVIPLNQLYKTATIEGQAGIIDEKKGKRIVFEPIIPQEQKEYYDLSHAQKRVWAASQYDGGNEAFNMPAAYRLEGPLDREALKRVFENLIQRHESLRTEFIDVNDEPKQRIRPPEEVEFTITENDVENNVENNVENDVENEVEREKDADALADQIIMQDVEQPFDLERTPLFRVRLIRQSDRQHILLLVMHHIIGDAESLAVLREEFDTLYEAFREGKTIQIPRLEVQYKDYAHQQNQKYLKNSEEIRRHRQYWKRELSGSSAPHTIPLDKKRPAGNTYNGGTVQYTQDKEITRKIRRLAQQHGVTTFMIYQAVLNQLVYSYTAATDNVTGVPVAGRQHADLQRQVGYYLNTLPIRLKIDPSWTFTQYLNNVREKVINAMTHQETPLDIIQADRAMGSGYNAAQPLFRVALNMINREKSANIGNSILKVSEYETGYHRTKFDLTQYIFEENGFVTGKFEYNSDIYEKETIVRLERRYRELLQRILEEPDAPLRQLLPRGLPKPGPLEPAKIEPGEEIPASYHQERLWFIDLFEAGNLYADSPIYHNIPVIMDIRGTLDTGALEQGINVVVKRHGVLRTRIVNRRNRPLQAIQTESRITLQIGDDVHNHRELEHITQEEINRPFKLDAERLIRAKLIKLTQQYRLIITLHHIIADNRTRRIITAEIIEAYRQQTGEIEPQPETAVMQYVDFSQNQRRQAPEQVEEYFYYWKRQLAGKLEPLELPTDRPRAHVHTYTAGIEPFAFSVEQTKLMRELVGTKEIEPAIWLLSVFVALLHCYTDQTEIVVGTVNDNRELLGTKEIAGPLANLQVLRMQLTGTESAAQLMEQVNLITTEAAEYGAMPFDRLVQELNPQKDMSRTAMFDVLFQYEENPQIHIKTEQLEIDIAETNQGWGKYDINLYIRSVGDQLDGTLVYNTDYFDRTRMLRFIDHFKNQCLQMTRNPDAPITDHHIVTLQERERLLIGLEAENADYPREITIPQLFVRQVEKNPDRVALLGNRIHRLEPAENNGGQQCHVTYSQLNRSARRWARRLRLRGVKEGEIVGFQMEQALETQEVILGVLMAGAAYMPIDPEAPPDRVGYQLEDSAARIIITTEKYAKKLDRNEAVDIVEKSAGNASGNTILDAALENEQKTDQSSLAYVIYTSGTTGRPKGVMVEQGNLVRLFFNDRNPFDFTERDVWTMFHNNCFDFSVWEMYGALLNGGKLVIIPRRQARDTEGFLSLLQQQGVTVLNQTPSAFYNLMSEELRHTGGSLNLRYIIFGGEALSPGRLKEWRNRYPRTKLINMYGITETTVHVTYKEIGETEIQADTGNIGKPIPTLTTQVMDQNYRLVPLGNDGELYVGGAGVSRGYMNRPELTAERFIDNPHRPGKRLYRSGDRVRLQENGEMIYKGRIDQQVQLRGYRVEPGEIESRLQQIEGIEEARVIDREDGSGERYLCAYIVAGGNTDDIDSETIKTIKNSLSKTLPDYMIPAYYVKLSGIPLTVNGKLDRSALPEPQRSIKSNQKYESPRNRTEEKLVQVWQRVLGIDKLGTNEDFFDIGGNSLKLVRLFKEIKEQVSESIKVQELFDNPTIRELALLIEKREKPDKPQKKKKKILDF
jgi:amino acid adenylation domain-containing protein